MIADPLRDFAEKFGSMDFGGVGRQLLSIADQIDRDHARRMEQSKRDTKRAYSRYLRGVMEDYTVRSVKRVARRKACVMQTNDGHPHRCSSCGKDVQPTDKFCHGCGAMLS